ncbi:MAG: MqnA/MqnD/SBP family protein, partial [Planctomycetota bacterium]|nr:MqnA/MqnD/SBP family protein [Planctomycetota bacterium]
MAHVLTLAHSPDPDDVFMWWPLGGGGAEPSFETGRFRFETMPEDIQALNRRAIERGDLDVTAISINTYALVRERYRLTDCAGSFGEGYGPKLVVRAGSDGPRAGAGAEEIGRWLSGRSLAVPGLDTTAYLVLRLAVGAAPAGRVVPTV